MKFKIEINKKAIEDFFLGIFLCIFITTAGGTALALFIWPFLLDAKMPMIARAIYFPSIFIATMIGNFILCFVKDKETYYG